jgi:phenylpyruvate tautomerase PptA (4-oxalocrotonate tautomerase family)
MPNVTIEIRRKYTPAEEENIIAAVHAALMEGLPLKRSVLYTRHWFAISKNLESRDHITILLRESGAENWGIRGGVPASEVDLGFKVDV